MKETELIKLYCHICECYDSTLRREIQRFSPNGNTGYITDEELMTIYLYCIVYGQRFTIKHMHKHITKYRSSWFPTLPSYATFNARLNRLWPAMALFIPMLMRRIPIANDLLPIYLADSCPVVTCKGMRQGKVAPELTGKGFCASKKMYYFGVKLHIIAHKRPNTLPLPGTILMTPASENDLMSIKDILETAQELVLVCDKAYCDQPLAQQMTAHNACLITPQKEIKTRRNVESSV
ncbi:MAG: transposase [Saprospiraceae bacterium]|nr:transposase [Saprospiraceae bacterium]